jgi:hypothetical protein
LVKESREHTAVSSRVLSAALSAVAIIYSSFLSAV